MKKVSMKKTILMLLFAPIVAFGQDTLTVSAEQRSFCLKVIKALIEHDCDKYIESISDSVVLYNSLQDTIVSKSAVEPQLMKLCDATVRNDSLDYQYYLENFQIEFYDVNAIAERVSYGNGDRESNLATLKHYKIEEGDVFFQGAYHKTRNRMDFILDDAFKFVFRKIDGEFKIIVITP